VAEHAEGAARGSRRWVISSSFAVSTSKNAAQTAASSLMSGCAVVFASDLVIGGDAGLGSRPAISAASRSRAAPITGGAVDGDLGEGCLGFAVLAFLGQPGGGIVGSSGLGGFADLPVVRSRAKPQTAAITRMTAATT